MKNLLLFAIFLVCLVACHKDEVASKGNGCHLTTFRDNLNIGGSLQYDSNGNLKRFSITNDAYLDFYYIDNTLVKVKAVNLQRENGQKLANLITFYPYSDDGQQMNQLVEEIKNPLDTTIVSTKFWNFSYDKSKHLRVASGENDNYQFGYDDKGNVISQIQNQFYAGGISKMITEGKYDENPNPLYDVGIIFGFIYGQFGGTKNLIVYLSPNNVTSYKDSAEGQITFTLQYDTRKYPTESVWKKDGNGVQTVGKTTFSYNCN